MNATEAAAIEPPTPIPHCRVKKKRVIKKEKIKQEPNVKAEPSTPAKRSRAVSAPTTRATRRQTRTRLWDTDDDLPLDAMALLGRRVMGLTRLLRLKVGRPRVATMRYLHL